MQIDVPTHDGASLRVLVDGAGTDLLLVSGLGGTAAFWNAVTARLGVRFRVIRLDQRGIGASTRGTARCTIDQLARDCISALDAAGSRRAVMLGHSTGGGIAMALANLAPDRIIGLGLSATWARPNRHMQALFGARRALLDHDPQSYAAMACLMSYPPEWLEANWQVYETAIARAALTPAATQVVRERIDALLTFDARSLIGNLSMPCLVLGARDDLIVPA
ncbi:MAG: alpha/beta fold hydrolase, partial [Bosea sp. (in: a-proteobacteria)]